MKTITVMDTSVASDNLGDEIIMDAVQKVLDEALPDAYRYRVPTHDWVGRASRRLIERSEMTFIGGTNILEPRMARRGSLWKLGLLDIKTFHSIVLLGVGWRGYMSPPDLRTKLLLKRFLLSDHIHSVRDSFTLGMLSDLPLKVSNTACMTMWSLSPEHCSSLPVRRRNNAVTTLTYYKADPIADRAMLSSLVNRYQQVWFWAQQRDDQFYFDSLNVSGIKVIPPQLAAYDAILNGEDVDFVGTRLHGGIRALQKGHRALIIAIDNRAQEIARDTDLPIVRRGEQEVIDAWCEESAPLRIRLPNEAIDEWKSQFR